MPGFKMNAAKEQTPIAEQDPKTRSGNFKEVCLGYTESEAQQEALRCARCRNRPCVEGCPVSVQIPEFVTAVAEGNFGRGFAIVKDTNALPAICGRVCPQETQCEGLCTRGRKGEPVAIGKLERFVADWAFDHPEQARVDMEAYARESERARRIAAEREALHGKRVAMVGSGPASLTCAGELVKYGIEVTVFEALHASGGVLTYGIPEFRLPKDLVVREIGLLEEQGVDIQLNAIVGKLYTIDELMDEMGFDAVFVGTGAGLPRYMGIEGEFLNGVSVANELLTRVNLMKAYDFPNHGTPVYAGKHCVVVGGGNVAMDAARTARRLGAHVTVAYRRGREEMPARIEEIEHAEEEGIVFETLSNPIRAVGDENGWVAQLECVRMELGEPDESGRRRPTPVRGSEYALECDMLVIAIGSATNPLIGETTRGMQMTNRNLIVADEETGATTRPGVFAGGDATTGAATVILAMGAGKKAARGIADYLKTI